MTNGARAADVDYAGGAFLANHFAYAHEIPDAEQPPPPPGEELLPGKELLRRAAKQLEGRSDTMSDLICHYVSLGFALSPTAAQGDC